MTWWNTHCDQLRAASLTSEISKDDGSEAIKEKQGVSNSIQMINCIYLYREREINWHNTHSLQAWILKYRWEITIFQNVKCQNLWKQTKKTLINVL